MTELIRCDACGTKRPPDDVGLFELVSLGPDLSTSDFDRSGPWHFCGFLCLRDWAAKHAPKGYATAPDE